MPEDIRLWKIREHDELQEIKTATLNFEERIENWLEKDISILSDDLFIIGRQVETDFGGIIDLLCLNSEGDIVIVELKRDKTPREITAQVLDYASWVNDLSNDRITEIAKKHLGNQISLEDSFKDFFGLALPEILNEHHKMLVVASKIDSSSERIINYLSSSYGVDINAATFNYFQDEENNEFLARVFLIEPEKAEYSSQTKSTSKRRRKPSFEEFEELAEQNGVGEIYKILFDGAMNVFDTKRRTQSSVTYVGVFKGSRRAVFSLIPKESSSHEGLRFQVYITRLVEYLHIDEKTATEILPESRESWVYSKDAPPEWSGYAGFFRDVEETTRFLERIKKLKNKMGSKDM